MTIIQILIFSIAALPLMFLLPATVRAWGLLLGSLLGVAWLMGEGGFTQVSYLLLFGTITLTGMTWWLIRPAGVVAAEDRVSLSIVVLFLVGLLLLIDARTPVLASVMFGGAALSVLRFAPGDAKTSFLQRRLLAGMVMVIVGLLVVLKLPELARLAGYSLNWNAGRIADASPLVWLGFSYIAFRLIALLQDARAGRLPTEGYSLREVMTYVLFFPAFTAGPIDRAQRFISELREAKPLTSASFVEGVGRIAIGLTKKFLIADTLALVAMQPDLIDQADTILGLWVLLYLYTFQIYLDFSGYSDVAIGIGRLLGITLPENFDRPYLQPNIQQFWQRWHITLSTWFRVYYFTPFSRALIRSSYTFPQWSIVLSSQITTMTLIGLWHGITWNFFVWGLWHGVGLFVFKIISDNTRNWYKRIGSPKWAKRSLHVFSVLLTFHFVALGWVFFALTDLEMSLGMLLRLFGLGG
jgi:alginate O-acetyltransferase complex protein AlgI